MFFCILGRLGRGKIKHSGDEVKGKVKERGRLLPFLSFHFPPSPPLPSYALEVLCLKVRASLQVLGLFVPFTILLQSLDPFGSKSRETRRVVVPRQSFEHFDLIFVKTKENCGVFIFKNNIDCFK